VCEQTKHDCKVSQKLCDVAAFECGVQKQQISTCPVANGIICARDIGRLLHTLLLMRHRVIRLSLVFAVAVMMLCTSFRTRCHRLAFRRGTQWGVRREINSISTTNTRTTLTGKGCVGSTSSKVEACEKVAVGSAEMSSNQHQLHELVNLYDSKKASVETAAQDAVLADGASSSAGKSVFADTVTFPTRFMIKIVGLNEPDFAADMVATVLSELGPQGTSPQSLSTKETAGGKYVSVSIKPFFRSADELYAVYDRIKLDKRVKFML
jgi:putative lipoic acid-binding regulatory protein